MNGNHGYDQTHEHERSQHASPTEYSEEPTVHQPQAVRRKLGGYVGFANCEGKTALFGRKRMLIASASQCQTRSTGKRRAKASISLLVCRRLAVLTAIYKCAQKFTVVVGESALGKSTLINTLFETQLYNKKEPLPPHEERPKTIAIESISAGRSLRFEVLDSQSRSINVRA